MSTAQVYGHKDTTPSRISLERVPSVWATNPVWRLVLWVKSNAPSGFESIEDVLEVGAANYNILRTLANKRRGVVLPTKEAIEKAMAAHEGGWASVDDERMSDWKLDWTTEHGLRLHNFGADTTKIWDSKAKAWTVK